MDTVGIVNMIDAALAKFSARDLVAGQEVVDFLLDLRTAAVSDEAIQRLIEQERQTTA